MIVEYVDPRADDARIPEPYELRYDVTDDQVTIGLLSNGFPDCTKFLDHVEDALSGQLEGATFRRYDKGDPSRPASEELLSGIAAEVAVAVAAFGH